MDGQESGSILNKLIHAEQAGMAQCLREAGCFVSWAGAAEYDLLQRMIQVSDEHIAWLTQRMDELGETPTPGHYNTRTASLHYVELQVAWSYLLVSQEQIISAYQQAMSLLTEDHACRDLLHRILQRHQQFLGEMQKFTPHHPAHC
ncbi:MAG: hypothetical protein HJJLKODD_00681 [Phycisphaerae bacterium]|nr:hypothetical protein [Phycisphaerae bacterium]